MPKISVIIPTFNNSHFIIDAIRSIINQTYAEYEIIVINDGSIDDTEEALKPYYHKIRYFYKNNGGVASARNYGIKESKGDYIAFLDSDDYWLTQKLEEVNKFIINYPSIGLFYSNAYQVGRTGKVIGVFKSQDFDSKLYFKILLNNFIPASSVVVKKEVFDTCGLFFEHFEAAAGGEDWDMWIRIAKKYKIKLIDKPLICYRVHQSNVSKKDFEKLNRDVLLILERALKNEIGIARKFKNKIYSNAFFHRGRRCLMAFLFKEARKELSQSIRLNPLQVKGYILMLISYLGKHIIKIFKFFYYNYRKFIVFVNFEV